MLKTNNEFIRFHFDKEYEIIPEKRSVEILPATHIKNFRVNSNNNNHINLSYSGNINNLNFSNFQNNISFDYGFSITNNNYNKTINISNFSLVPVNNSSDFYLVHNNKKYFLIKTNSAKEYYKLKDVFKYWNADIIGLPELSNELKMNLTNVKLGYCNISFQLFGINLLKKNLLNKYTNDIITCDIVNFDEDKYFRTENEYIRFKLKKTISFHQIEILPTDYSSNKRNTNDGLKSFICRTNGKKHFNCRYNTGTYVDYEENNDLFFTNGFIIKNGNNLVDFSKFRMKLTYNNNTISNKQFNLFNMNNELLFTAHYGWNILNNNAKALKVCHMDLVPTKLLLTKLKLPSNIDSILGSMNFKSDIHMISEVDNIQNPFNNYSILSNNTNSRKIKNSSEIGGHQLKYELSAISSTRLSKML